MSDCIFDCSHCLEPLVADEAGIGHVVSCTKCGIELTIPNPSIRFICPFCKASLSAPKELNYRIRDCPHCLASIVVSHSTGLKHLKRCPHCSADMMLEGEVLNNLKNGSITCLLCGADSVMDQESGNLVLLDAHQATALPPGDGERSNEPLATTPPPPASNDSTVGDTDTGGHSKRMGYRLVLISTFLLAVVIGGVGFALVRIGADKLSTEQRKAKDRRLREQEIAIHTSQLEKTVSAAISMRHLDDAIRMLNAAIGKTSLATNRENAIALLARLEKEQSDEQGLRQAVETARSHPRRDTAMKILQLALAKYPDAPNKDEVDSLIADWDKTDDVKRQTTDMSDAIDKAKAAKNTDDAVQIMEIAVAKFSDAMNWQEGHDLLRTNRMVAANLHMAANTAMRDALKKANEAASCYAVIRILQTALDEYKSAADVQDVRQLVEQKLATAMLEQERALLERKQQQKEEEENEQKKQEEELAWRGMRPGMDRAQVRSLLGSPSVTSRYERYGTSWETWVYHTYHGEKHVLFNSGPVEDWTPY